MLWLWIKRLNPGFLVFFLLFWIILLLPVLMLGGARPQDSLAAMIYLCGLWLFWFSVFGSPLVSERARALLIKPEYNVSEARFSVAPMASMFAIFLLLSLFQLFVLLGEA